MKVGNELPYIADIVADIYLCKNTINCLHDIQIIENIVQQPIENLFTEKIKKYAFSSCYTNTTDEYKAMIAELQTIIKRIAYTEKERQQIMNLYYMYV